MTTAGPGTTLRPNVPPVEDSENCYQDGMLCVPKFTPKEKYVVLFGRKSYTVPYENVWLVPKYTNPLQDNGVQLGSIISSRNWHNWHSYLRWGHLCVLTGIEGMGVYTTFALPYQEWGQTGAGEQRILRPVPHEVLRHAFDWPHTSMVPHGVAINNVRRQRRCDIYKWKKEIDMPHHAQIHPERNGWPETAEVVTSRAVRMFSRRSRPPSPLPGAPAPESESDEEDEELEPEPPPVSVLVPLPPVSAASSADAAIYSLSMQHEDFEEPEDAGPDVPEPDEEEEEPEAPKTAEARDALRDVEAELFEAKDRMPEGAYLSITNALKRTWDCL